MQDPRRFPALTLVLFVALSAGRESACAQAADYTTRPATNAAEHEGVELLRNGVPLDTIDAAFGWHGVRGGILYRDDEGKTLFFASHEGTPHPVEGLVPAYRDEDAMPSVFDSLVAFWSFAPDPGGGFHVRAVRNDFGSGRSDTTNLYSDYLDANNPAVYHPPRKEGDLVIYGVDGAALWLDAQWRVVRRRGRD